jgi:hypothetical protein
VRGVSKVFDWRAGSNSTRFHICLWCIKSDDLLDFLASFISSQLKKIAFSNSILIKREGILPVMLSLFASDFIIPQIIFDDNIDKDSLFHSGINIQKAEKKKQNRQYQFQPLKWKAHSSNVKIWYCDSFCNSEKVRFRWPDLPIRKTYWILYGLWSWSSSLRFRAREVASRLEVDKSRIHCDFHFPRAVNGPGDDMRDVEVRGIEDFTFKLLTFFLELPSVSTSISRIR